MPLAVACRGVWGLVAMSKGNFLELPQFLALHKNGKLWHNTRETICCYNPKRSLRPPLQFYTSPSKGQVRIEGLRNEALAEKFCNMHTTVSGHNLIVISYRAVKHFSSKFWGFKCQAKCLCKTSLTFIKLVKCNCQYGRNVPTEFVYSQCSHR